MGMQLQCNESQKDSEDGEDNFLLAEAIRNSNVA